jgi:Fibronectin type III domain
VPLPAIPANVTASPAAGGYQVSWDAGSAAITSSTVTATPVGSPLAPVVATVSGTATTALIGPLAPLTTYQLTVVSTDNAGSSPPSDAITVTTAASAAVPAAPTGVSARWNAVDTMAVTWRAATGGDSPVDAYQVTATGSDHAGTFTQSVAGTTLSATLSVSDIPDWSIKVRAHDAAGWGPWSSTARLGGT